MTDDRYAVILVHSISYALRTEKVLASAEVACKLIPVPRQLSSDCGVCVRILQEHEQPARQALEETGVEIDGLHRI